MGRKSWHPRTVGQNRSLQVSKSTSDLQTPCFWVPPCLLVGSKLLKLCSLKRWVSLETGRILSCFPLFPCVLAKMSSLMVRISTAENWKHKSSGYRAKCRACSPTARHLLWENFPCPEFLYKDHQEKQPLQSLHNPRWEWHFPDSPPFVTTRHRTLEGITKHGKIAPAATHAGWAWLGFFFEANPVKEIE